MSRADSSSHSSSFHHCCSPLMMILRPFALLELSGIFLSFGQSSTLIATKLGKESANLWILFNSGREDKVRFWSFTNKIRSPVIAATPPSLIISSILRQPETMRFLRFGAQMIHVMSFKFVQYRMSTVHKL
ncbi:hypothetical protein SLA2020_011450 [Shorea laevis]